MRSKQTWLRAALCVSLLAMPVVLVSAELGNVKNLRAPQPSAQTVEMFEAIKSKDIEVKIIPKDETESRVFIKNNTKQPLNVKLPAAFAGMPVLAQRVGSGTGGSRTGGGASSGGQQSMGGGMGGGGMGMGGGGMGGGMFNIAPEQEGRFKVATVCLEHGKKEPRANIPYEIKPIETFTAKPGVKELLTAFGNQKISQRAAQAAAWHLSNDMSWEQLAAKKIEHLNGTSEFWFSREEIQAGMQLARSAMVEAEANAKAVAVEEGVKFTPVFEKR